MTTTVNCKAKITRLLHIFKEEGKLLRTGKLVEVTALTSIKTTAMSDMEAAFHAVDNPKSDPQLRPYLQALEKMGQENARLLQAALAGARAAKLRLDQLQFQHAQVGTYDSNGQKHHLTQNHINTKKIV